MKKKKCSAHEREKKSFQKQESKKSGLSEHNIRTLD
jgi:hypothetical protein